MAEPTTNEKLDAIIAYFHSGHADEAFMQQVRELLERWADEDRRVDMLLAALKAKKRAQDV